MSHSNRRNAHVAYGLAAPAIVGFRICAGAPAPRQRQTRREAGAQSLRASLGEAAGLPNGGGVATSALEDSTLDPRKEWCIFGDEDLRGLVSHSRSQGKVHDCVPWQPLW